MATIVLTVLGDDRPGLVSALADAVADRGGNWREGQMARLGGKFAGIVLVEVPDDAIEGVRGDAERLGREVGLDVQVTPVTSPEAAADAARGARYVVSLVGRDRPGIVRDVSAALAGRGVSIDELSTSTYGAPQGDGDVFEAEAVVLIPEAVGTDEVRDVLEAVAAELMVDLDLTGPGEGIAL